MYNGDSRLIDYPLFYGVFHMELILYTVIDSDNTIGKTKTNDYSLEINLKADTDIIRPSILLMEIAGVDFKDFNYAYIPMLERYYLITDIENINNKMWRLNCECDVLETYKAEILASNARLKRQLKTGDYENVFIESSVAKTVSTFESDGGFKQGESSVILTTIGI